MKQCFNLFSKIYSWRTGLLRETVNGVVYRKIPSPDSSGNPCGAFVLPHKIETYGGNSSKKNSPTTFVIGECNNKELKRLLVNDNPLS